MKCIDKVARLRGCLHSHAFVLSFTCFVRSLPTVFLVLFPYIHLRFGEHTMGFLVSTSRNAVSLEKEVENEVCAITLVHDIRNWFSGLYIYIYTYGNNYIDLKQFCIHTVPHFRVHQFQTSQVER